MEQESCGTLAVTLAGRFDAGEALVEYDTWFRRASVGDRDLNEYAK